MWVLWHYHRKYAELTEAWRHTIYEYIWQISRVFNGFTLFITNAMRQFRYCLLLQSILAIRYNSNDWCVALICKWTQCFVMVCDAHSGANKPKSCDIQSTPWIFVQISFYTHLNGFRSSDYYCCYGFMNGLALMGKHLQEEFSLALCINTQYGSSVCSKHGISEKSTRYSWYFEMK